MKFSRKGAKGRRKAEKSFFFVPLCLPFAPLREIDLRKEHSRRQR